MSVFFEQLLEGSGQATLHIDVSWHRTYAILAVASFSNEGSGFIQFYNDEGSLTSKASLPGHGVSVQIVAIQWHPSRKVLAIACEGGALYTWNDYEQELLPSTLSQHRSAVTVLCWSSCGSRLVSTDSNGSLVAWKANSKGQLDVVFHHELKEQLNHVVFRTTGSQSHSDTNVRRRGCYLVETVIRAFSPFTPRVILILRDVGGLARAAVSGDEQALDLFSSLQVKDRESVRLDLSRTERKSDLSFYVATSSGAVYFISDDGSCVGVLDATYAFHCMLFHQERNLMVVVNEAPLVIQYTSNGDGSLDEVSKVKFASKMSDVETIWAGIGLLVLSGGDLSLRFWDVDSGDSYSVMMEGKHLREGLEHISTIAYNEEQNVLVAGTNLGNIHMWSRSKEKQATQDPEKLWVSYGICSIKGAVKQLRWSGIPDNMAVNASTCLYMLTAQKICFAFNNQIAAIQLTPNQLILEYTASGRHVPVSVDVQIRGVDITTDNVVAWSGMKVAVYEIGVEGARTQQVGCFPCNATQIAVYEQSLYTVENGKVQVRTFQGTIKQSLVFLESEGDVTHINVCSSYLVVATSLNILKIWEISRREAKPFTSPKHLPESLNGGGQISSLRCNCNGSKVSLLLSKDHRLIVWDVEADRFMEHEFENDFEKSMAKKTQFESNSCETATFHYWDAQEPRLLVCEISHSRSQSASRIVSLFVTTEHGVLVQDSIDVDPLDSSLLLGIQVPNYYFIKQSNIRECMLNKMNDDHSSAFVDTVTMRDFAGLDKGDTTTRDAMINFGFYLAVGNMDEAFKAIKKIKSGKVWENMARMCVKTKRLDVALVCLGNMGHARGARALREALLEPELDARVAALAIQLGMLVEAEELYKSCSRFDLLNNFYQASNQWQKALTVAQSEDRIHLRATFYNYAKYLETKGDISGAITNFEKSQTHCFEVPRMLFDELPALEHYIISTKNKKLYQWWAQYMESTGEMETAIQFYEKADDHLSLVRVYCYCDNLDKAAEIAAETGARAACYHLGRRYENDGNIKGAVHFFEKAQAYNNAIRICKEHHLEDQLLNLALMGGPEEILDVARYYELKEDQVERAVMLYLKGGLVAKAAELAFKCGHNTAMEMLACELNETTEPSVLRRCALFFIENGHHGKAVDLLAKAREYSEAVALCLEHNVTLSENLVEMLTPTKDEMDAVRRSELLEKVADGCYQQGNYHLATKKFTQAGNKVKAMKALLKSGDTERIVFFANVSRQKEIYIMAANYLQTLDWRQDPEIMKNVVAFYTKGKTPELLAGFYDACAQVEIDEFQNYSKALGALNEACKCLSTGNAKRASIAEDKLEQLRIKLDFVKRFLQARRVYDEDPSESMKLCENLLEERNLNVGVRPGDVYAFMIEHYAQKQNFKMAYNLIEEMRSKLPNVNLAFYVDTKTLETIKDNLNFPYNNDNHIFMNNNMRETAATRRRSNQSLESDEEEVAEGVVKDESILKI